MGRPHGPVRPTRPSGPGAPRLLPLTEDGGRRRPGPSRRLCKRMCGIAGIVASDWLHADERVRVGLMRDVLAHRGPDDAGLFADEHASLGHRRLSIVDLAAGHQPLANEDESIWIVFNGEIYNH